MKKYISVTGVILFIISCCTIRKHEDFAVVCMLLSFLLFFVLLILLIKALINYLFKPHLQKIQNKPADIENLKPFLCSVSNLRKKDGNVKKGDCVISFDGVSFVISQSEEKIENDIESIYYFDIWDYKDETYFKIRMRSKTEYIFKSIHFEADKIARYLRQKGIKIEDNRE